MKEVDLKCPEEVLEKWTKVVEKTAVEILDERLFRIECALENLRDELKIMSDNIHRFIASAENLKRYLDELEEVLGFKEEEK